MKAVEGGNQVASGHITTWKKCNRLEFEVLNIDIVENGRLKVSPWRRHRSPYVPIFYNYLLRFTSMDLST
ncbi:unnamed protein product, partial [Arabidopsis halleri]